MNISQKQNGELGAIITIEVKKEDYQQKVEKAIKNFTKNANVPGFRPGHVPSGMIRKKYGREILIEELNHILNDNLYDYIREQKLNILGSPLPVDSSQDIVEGQDFKFEYEVGLAPEIDPKFPKEKISFYAVKADEKMIESEISRLQRQYGEFLHPEAANENSILYGTFQELDQSLQKKEEGHTNTTTLSLSLIKDSNEQQKFMGAKVGDVIVTKPMTAMQNEAEVAAMLNVPKDSPALQADYSFTVISVNEIIKAEINQAFFDKVFGEGIVTSEEEFRKKIAETISSYYNNDGERKLRKDVKNMMLESHAINLPDDFLKRMLKSRNEGGDSHDFDHQYFHLAEDLRWDLIKNKIAEMNSIRVEMKDVEAAAEVMVAQQFAQYGMAPPEKEKMDDIVKNYLDKEDNRERLYSVMLDQKVFEHIKQNLNLNTVELPFEEFEAKVQEKTAHEMAHHH